MLEVGIITLGGLTEPGFGSLSESLLKTSQMRLLSGVKYQAPQEILGQGVHKFLMTGHEPCVGKTLVMQTSSDA